MRWCNKCRIWRAATNQKCDPMPDYRQKECRWKGECGGGEVCRVRRVRLLRFEKKAGTREGATHPLQPLVLFRFSADHRPVSQSGINFTSRSPHARDKNIRMCLRSNGSCFRLKSHDHKHSNRVLSSITTFRHLILTSYRYPRDPDLSQAGELSIHPLIEDRCYRRWLWHNACVVVRNVVK